MAKLTKLYLDQNEIGDAGMAALSTALGSGAIPQLQDLRFRFLHPGAQRSREPFRVRAVGNTLIAGADRALDLSLHVLIVV